MPQEKKELTPIKGNMPHNILSSITRFLPFVSSLCRSDNQRKENHLLSRLAQYAAKGNVEQVARLVTIRPDLRVQVLFTLAGLGAQDQMEAILKNNPRDLVLSRPLRDISGAAFPSICLFQHAIWAKDVRYMANMMLDCLPQNEEGEQIRLEMVRQYEELIAQGVIYQLKGVKHEKERHFNLEPFIIALETYVKEHKNWTATQRKSHWCTVVGLAQTVLPAIFRHHYCDTEELFWDKPNFKKPKLKRSLEIYNWVLGKYQLWSEGVVELGVDFGLCRLRGCFRCGGLLPLAGPEVAAGDLAALKALDKMRTTIDMPLLIDRLYTPIQKLEENLTVQVV